MSPTRFCYEALRLILPSSRALNPGFAASMCSAAPCRRMTPWGVYNGLEMSWMSQPALTPLAGCGAMMIFPCESASFRKAGISIRITFFGQCAFQRGKGVEDIKGLRSSSSMHFHALWTGKRIGNWQNGDWVIVSWQLNSSGLHEMF